MNNQILSLTTSLAKLIESLDFQRDNLWNLRFKDFEDLARAIDSYEECYDEAYDVLSQLTELLTKKYINEGMDELEADGKANEVVSADEESLTYHHNELNYFRQKQN